MPELPEVETVARALRPHLIQRKILRTEVTTKKLRNILDVDLGKDTLMCGIVAVIRRAKYIIVELEKFKVIVLHLGMSGSCRVEKSSSPARKHDHISWYLDNEFVWRFNDPRKFGLVRIEEIEDSGVLPLSLQSLPPEPLGPNFTSAYFHGVIQNRIKTIKSILIDNTLIAGIGNIYACESLFLAQVNPMTQARKLKIHQIESLVTSIKRVLRDAIHAGGTTIINFKSVDGSEGKFSRKLHVYGKEGKACPKCKDTIITRTIISGRSTYYCPKCQKEGNCKKNG